MDDSEKISGETGELLAADLLRASLRIRPLSLTRQHLTQSGNAIFRALLPDDKSVVIRISPRAGAFKYTGQNLLALRQLGLPVQSVLGDGPTPTGGSFIILNWIPGRDLMYELPTMRPVQVTRLARSIADYQKRIGTLPMSQGFGWAPIGQNAPSPHWTDIFGPPDTSPIPVDASPTQQLRGRLRALRQCIEPYFATVQPVCFLDDLTIKNILVENGELTGTIDADFVCYGDPLMSLGTTVSLIAADVGAAGQFYGQELLRFWNPSGDQIRAIHFYTALWTIGLLNAAETAGDLPRAARLQPIADAMLQLAEQAVASQDTDLEKLLAVATDQHRAGNLPGAERMYQQLLMKVPDHAVARFRLGLLEMQQGNLQSALALIQHSAAACPDEPRYHSGLAEVLMALRNWEPAASAYRRVLQLDPQSADAHFGLGNALQSQGDYRTAIPAYQAAVQIQGDFADACNNLGNCQKLLGNLPQAEIAYRQALAIRPNYTAAMSNLGTVLLAQGQAGQAIEHLSAGHALEPDVAAYAVNLAAAYCQQRQFPLAQSLLCSVLERDSNNVEAHYNLGNALYGLGLLRDAAEQYQAAVALKPDHTQAWNNLGNLRRELGEFQLAAEAYESARRVPGDSVIAINNIACLLRTLGRLEESETILRQGLAIDANHPALHDNLGSVLKDTGRLDEAIASFRRSLELDPTAAAVHSNLVYALSFQATQAKPILEECLRWNDHHAAALRPQIAGHPNDPTPGRRLRIGYVSPDFRDHCQSLFTIPLLSHHDHGRFEIFCYSSVERPDAYTRRLIGYADVWRDVRPLDDAALSDLIRSDHIDILVDLTMHMANGRPLLFARKPAPIQLAWLAYPGTTGLAAMDYRFSDPRLDPPGSENDYREQTIHLPDSFWCYDPLTNEPEVNELPALSRGYLTLGCLNNPCKLTDTTLTLWGAVLRALPLAQLVLMAPPGPGRQHLLRRLAAQDIAAERVEFLSYRPRPQYLRSYHRIDLGLDTFPYNGHTTSLDSFWMGVPVVTRIGQTCVGRGGLSQLFQLDLVELAAETDRAFTDIVVNLANDLPRLARLRQQLRPRIEASPLMDGKRFARNIESAYQKLWQDYCDDAVKSPRIS